MPYPVPAEPAQALQEPPTLAEALGPMSLGVAVVRNATEVLYEAEAAISSIEEGPAAVTRERERSSSLAQQFDSTGSRRTFVRRPSYAGL